MDPKSLILGSDQPLEPEITPGQVRDFYTKLETGDSKPIRPDVVQMIDLYPYWTKKQLTIDQLGQLEWYFDNNPNHVSWFLTKSGHHRSTADVAKVYMSLDFDELRDRWDRSRDINQMVDLLTNGDNMPPMIIVEGSRYPQGPKSNYIDGFHRALAYMAFSIINPEEKILIDVYSGQKAPILDRLTQKFNNFIR